MSTTTPAGRRARLAPEERRSQLLDLGVRLLATRSVEELSVEVLAEEGGVSRGLLVSIGLDVNCWCFKGILREFSESCKTLM